MVLSARSLELTGGTVSLLGEDVRDDHDLVPNLKLFSLLQDPERRLHALPRRVEEVASQCVLGREGHRVHGAVHPAPLLAQRLGERAEVLPADLPASHR